MFKCEKCNQSAPSPRRVVVERREMEHLGGFKGTQIVKELNVCDACLASTPEAPKPERIVTETVMRRPTITLNDQPIVHEE
jgi:hypothetical protein